MISSFFSSVYKVASGRMAYSLGASGAICALLGVFGTIRPDAHLQIIFLPFLVFTAATGIKGMMALDTLGLVMGWRFFDHAAHLSGILSGVLYCHYGNKLVWENRGPLMQWWHENVRGGKRS